MKLKQAKRKLCRHLWPGPALLLALLLSACNEAVPSPTATEMATKIALESPTGVPTTTKTPRPGGTSTPLPTPTATGQPTSPPTATTSPTPPPAPTATGPTATQSSVYKAADCRFDLPAGQTVECGFLTVPASRSRPGGATIRLHVATFKSSGSNPKPDPIVYLAGGPGGNPLESVFLTFNRRFGPLIQTRDLIIFDQRGSGLSDPALDCPEILAFNYKMLAKDLSGEDMERQLTKAILACHKRLVNKGIDLTIFNSAENAADLNDLRLALGYGEWNLYGASYGTRLALTAMRDQPQGIRSVVLDSAYPLESSLYEEVPANADRAFQVLFDGCAKDPGCQETFPDLETVLRDTVAQLEQTPVMISITNPLTAESFEMLVDGHDLIDFLFTSLYASEVIPLLPQIIFDARQNIFDTFALIQGSLLVDAEFISRGMHYSVQCHEEAPFSNPGDLAAAAQMYPRVKALFEEGTFGEMIFTVCDAWGAGEVDPLENQPVRSDIPTLVIAGEYDPITPPAWGAQVAENLSNSFYFEFPGAGHGASFSDDCPRGITLAFLDDPSAAPDATCIATMGGPAFQVPLKMVTLVPFTNKTFGISGLVPEGWEEIAPGVFGTANRAIVQQGGPLGLSAEELLSFIITSFKLEEVPERAGSREANGLSWSLYELEALGTPLDLAVTDHGYRAYIILMQAPPADHNFLYREVFLPAIDALSVNNGEGSPP